MTKQQVAVALSLPADTMVLCSRPLGNGGSEVEIVGSSPPWMPLRPGYHTITLEFDSSGCVVRGSVICFDAECDDDEALQLRPRQN